VSLWATYKLKYFCLVENYQLVLSPSPIVIVFLIQNSIHQFLKYHYAFWFLANSLFVYARYTTLNQWTNDICSMYGIFNLNNFNKNRGWIWSCSCAKVKRQCLTVSKYIEIICYVSDKVKWLIIQENPIKIGFFLSLFST
jgi:hypothetical protein